MLRELISVVSIVVTAVFVVPISDACDDDDDDDAKMDVCPWNILITVDCDTRGTLDNDEDI